MAYTKKNYPEFKDIKIWHMHGFDGESILGAMVDFITDPAHATYRLIDIRISYMDALSPSGLTRTQTDHPSENLWVEVNLIYTE